METDPSTAVGESMDLASEQRKDTLLKEMIHYLEKGKLPEDGRRARQIAAQGPSFVLDGGILHFVDKSGGHKRIVLPDHLRRDVMGRLTAGHVGATSLETDCSQL